MKGKTVLITGGNGGIGRATAEELAKRGANVVILCRSKERGEEARADIAHKTGNSNVELLICDLSSMADVRRAAEEFKKTHSRLDVLINNAGVFLPKREVTSEGLEKTFATNYLSNFVLTLSLLDLLKASAPSRIVNVATRTGWIKIDLDDMNLEKGYSIMKAVGASKIAQILFTIELARRLQGTGVTVNALHPGIIKSGLLEDVPWVMRTFFNLLSTTPEKGARTPVFLASADEVANVSGKLFADSKEIKMGGQATDPASVKRLWDRSVELSKMQPPI